MTAPPDSRMRSLMDAIDRAHAEAAGLVGDLRGRELDAVRRMVSDLVHLKRAARGLALVSGRMKSADLEVSR